MANTGLLRDWLWFWQNGMEQAKNPNNISKTSDLNLTIDEAKTQYYLDESIIDPSLPGNEMIANDSIKFLKFYGGLNGFGNCQDSDLKHLYIGGSFDKVNNTNYNNIVRLRDQNNIDNGLPIYVDNSFNIGTGFNGEVNTICVIKDTNGYAERIYVGGKFTSYNGTSCNRIICLNTDGSINSSFNIGTGFDWFVNVIKKHPDPNNKTIYVGGSFNTYKGIQQKYIVQLNPDGSKVTTFTQTNFVGPVLDLDYTWWNYANARWTLVLVGLFSYVDYKGRSCNNLVWTEMSGIDYNRMSDNLVLTGQPWIFNGPINKVRVKRTQNDPTRSYDALVSGIFTKVNNENRGGFAELRYDGFKSGNHLKYVQSIDGNGNGILLTNHYNATNGNPYILYGGAFNTVYLHNQGDINTSPESFNNIFPWGALNSGQIGEGAWGGEVKSIEYFGTNGLICIVGSIMEGMLGQRTGGIILTSTNDGHNYTYNAESSDKFNPNNQ